MKRLLLAALAAALMIPMPARAAEYPSQPVTIIAGFNAGGTSDIVLRAMAPELEKLLGQPVLIVNKGGNGGALAIGDLLTKKADGYTVGLVSNAAFTLDTQLKKARYSMDDFIFLGSAGLTQQGYFSLPDKPWKDFKGLVEYAKQSGKELTFCSPDIMPKILIDVVCAKEGIKVRYVPTKSGGETATSVLGGHTDFGYGGGIQTPYVQAGKMINLASSTRTPFIKFPDVPTLLSLGYPNTGFDTHYVFFVKKDTPVEIREKLAAAFDKVANLESIQDVILNKANLSPHILKAEEIMPFLKAQYNEYTELLKNK